MDRFRSVRETQRDCRWVQYRVGCELFERLLLLSPIEVVRIGSLNPTRDAWMGFENAYDSACIMKRKRLKQEAIDNAEDRCIGADAQGHGHDRGDGESIRKAKLPQCVAKIPQNCFHHPDPHDL